MSWSAQTGDTASSADRIVIAASGVILGSCLAIAARDLAVGHSVRWHIVVPYLLALLVGEIMRVSLPSGRQAAPLSTAAAIALALDTGYASARSFSGVPSVIALAGTGMIFGALPFAFVGRASGVASIGRRILVVASLAGLFRVGVWPYLPPDWTSGTRFAAVVTVLLSITVLLDTVLSGAMRAAETRAHLLTALRDEARATLGLNSAVAATAALIVLGANVMSSWSLLVFSVPLLIAQFSFKKYAGVRATYLQTIRSLARATEVGGYTETGHARRVSELSVAVGRALGMNEPALLDLEYASLLHDIGQLSLDEPIPGGATVMSRPDERRRIAELGAAVVRETGVLDHVAEMVERQADPYWHYSEGEDSTVPLGSRVIHAVNDFDDLVGGSLEWAVRQDAIDRLRLGVATDYDPRVIDALADVVARYSRVAI